MNKTSTKKKITDIAGLVTLAIFFLADRIFKQLSLDTPDFSIIPGWLDFHFFANRNIAFSLPLSGKWLSAFIIVIILGLSLYLFVSWQKLNRWERIGFISIVSGALSNLFDRLVYGFVIDYLDLKWFAIFNLADVLIVIGAIIVLIGILKSPKQKELL